MKHTTLAAAVAASLALGGCAYFRTEPPAIQINYEAANTDATGLIRAFDTKGNTVLQFFDVTKARPTIYGDGQAAPLKFEIVGQQLASCLARSKPSASKRTARPPPSPARASLPRSRRQHRPPHPQPWPPGQLQPPQWPQRRRPQRQPARRPCWASWPQHAENSK